MVTDRGGGLLYAQCLTFLLELVVSPFALGSSFFVNWVHLKGCIRGGFSISRCRPFLSFFWERPKKMQTKKNHILTIRAMYEANTWTCARANTGVPIRKTVHSKDMVWVVGGTYCHNIFHLHNLAFLQPHLHFVGLAEPILLHRVFVRIGVHLICFHITRKGRRTKCR